MMLLVDTHFPAEMRAELQRFNIRTVEQLVSEVDNYRKISALSQVLKIDRGQLLEIIAGLMRDYPSARVPRAKRKKFAFGHIVE